MISHLSLSAPCGWHLLVYPPGELSAGFRHRESKTQAGAVGVVCQPAVHDDNMKPNNNAAIPKAIEVLMPFTYSHGCP
jgi:hypothetical protein